MMDNRTIGMLSFTGSVEAGWTRLRVVISIAIGVLATVWFVQRALFG